VLFFPLIVDLLILALRRHKQLMAFLLR